MTFDMGIRWGHTVRLRVVRRSHVVGETKFRWSVIEACNRKEKVVGVAQTKLRALEVASAYLDRR
jgi:hypothetical protein